MPNSPGNVRRRVGRNVRHLRKLRKFSQEELAARAGNTQKHVSQIERGQTNVGLDVLAKLASALNADVADLIGSTSGAALFALSKRDLNLVTRALEVVHAVRTAPPRTGKKSG
jgi:transcriptional regulator with XRE-family HTH domain